MKKYLLFLGLLGAGALSSCESFLDVNNNPNNPTETTPNFLLPNIISNGIQTQMFTSLRTPYIEQYLVSRTVNSGGNDQYRFTNAQSTNTFNYSYFYSGGNIPPMLKAAQAEGSLYYVGAGKIMQALILAHLTDMIGDVPYTEAYQGGSNYKPKYDSQEQLYATINGATLQRFMQTAALDTATVFASIKSGKPASAVLKTTISATAQSTYQDIESYNVVGKVTGSDAKLKNEYVVHSAHLDHLGITAPVQGDSINNGAHDNASGVSCVLEIAKIYSKLKDKPKRSILFVFMTGEELGLLGSAAFAANPTVPKANLVADVNMDMPTIIAPLLSVVALGGQHSSLLQPVTKAAAYMGITLEQDPEPEQNRFIRSDQYSFVTAGIPALHLKYGNKTADGKNNLNETVQKWRAVTYHKPQDDINGTFDFEAGKKYVQLCFLIGYQVAQNPVRPTWNKGDFFGARYGKR